MNTSLELKTIKRNRFRVFRMSSEIGDEFTQILH